jgi:hypothetical protein
MQEGRSNGNSPAQKTGINLCKKPVMGLQIAPSARTAEPTRCTHMPLSPLLLECSELILEFFGHRVMMNELSVFD